MIFFTGLHHPSVAWRFLFACISINQLWTRKKPLGRRTLVLIDSGAFTILDTHGHYPESHSVERYAYRLWQIYTLGIANIMAAVAQDYMCEERITAKTGLTVLDHQRLTIERYDALVAELRRLFGGDVPFHVMPVLQGRSVADYLRHIDMYGARLTPGMWVGVGSVCKRQGDPKVIATILTAIKRKRPDLWLHGFGVKSSALAYAAVRKCLASSDSLAWSDIARKLAGRLLRPLARQLGVKQIKPSAARPILAARGITLPDPNDWREAKRWRRQISRSVREPEQLELDLAA